MFTRRGLLKCPLSFRAPGLHAARLARLIVNPDLPERQAY